MTSLKKKLIEVCYNNRSTDLYNEKDIEQYLVNEIIQVINRPLDEILKHYDPVGDCSYNKVPPFTQGYLEALRDMKEILK